MLRYVDDYGKLVVRYNKIQKPSVKESKRTKIDFSEIEKEIQQDFEEWKKKPKAFFCIDLIAFITLLACWEIIVLLYYLGVALLRWMCKCDGGHYSHFVEHPYWYGFAAACPLFVMGWSLLLTLPDKNVTVVLIDLIVHILTTLIFAAATLISIIEATYGSMAMYLCLTAFYTYVDVLFNTLMKDISNDKYDIAKYLR